MLIIYVLCFYDTTLLRIVSHKWGSIIYQYGQNWTYIAKPMVRKTYRLHIIAKTTYIVTTKFQYILDKLKIKLKNSDYVHSEP